MLACWCHCEQETSLGGKCSLHHGREAAPKEEPPSHWQDGKNNLNASFETYFILKHDMVQVLTPASVLSYCPPLRSHCCFGCCGKEAFLLPQSLCPVQVMLHNVCTAEVEGFACLWLGRTLVSVVVEALQPLAQLSLKSAERLWWYYYYCCCSYYYHCCYCFPLISYHFSLLKKSVLSMSLESWQW